MSGLLDSIIDEHYDILMREYLKDIEYYCSNEDSITLNSFSTTKNDLKQTIVYGFKVPFTEEKLYFPNFKELYYTILKEKLNESMVTPYVNDIKTKINNLNSEVSHLKRDYDEKHRMVYVEFLNPIKAEMDKKTKEKEKLIVMLEQLKNLK
jgi:hypothetical protein